MVVPEKIYRHRGALASPPLIFALFASAHQPSIGAIAWMVGLLCFLAGLLVRIWAQQHLHYRLNIKKYLTNTGPYVFIRNPIYIGNTLICVGLVIASQVLWLIPITILYCMGLYSLVVRCEEAKLEAEFGELYQKYKLETPRWIPRSPSFDKLQLVNEYLGASLVAEAHNLLLLIPFVFKGMMR